MEDVGVLQLGQADDHAETGGGVAEHLDQQILHELELADGPDELLALLGVAQRDLVRGDHDADCLPGDAAAGPAQDLGGQGLSVHGMSARRATAPRRGAAERLGKPLRTMDRILFTF